MRVEEGQVGKGEQQGGRGCRKAVPYLVMTIIFKNENGKAEKLWLLALQIWWAFLRIRPAVNPGTGFEPARNKLWIEPGHE